MEEEDDDEGEPWPFLKLEGRGGGSAPCHRQRLRSHLSRMRSTLSVLSKREMQSGPSSGVPDGWSEHKPPEASLQSAAPALNIERWNSAGAGGGILNLEYEPVPFSSLTSPFPEPTLPSPPPALCRHLHTFLPGASATRVSSCQCHEGPPPQQNMQPCNEVENSKLTRILNS